MDGKSVNGRKVLVRFPESNDAIEVQNLSDSVTNELLAEAFCTFGAVEEAIVATDSRGRSLNYGVVRFASRQSAQHAITACSEGHFLLTRCVCVRMCACCDVTMHCICLYVSDCLYDHACLTLAHAAS